MMTPFGWFLLSPQGMLMRHRVQTRVEARLAFERGATQGVLPCPDPNRIPAELPIPGESCEWGPKYAKDGTRVLLGDGSMWEYIGIPHKSETWPDVRIGWIPFKPERFERPLSREFFK